MTFKELQAAHDWEAVEEALAAMVKFYEQDAEQNRDDVLLASLEDVFLAVRSIEIEEAS